ncbi:hypothetical protein MMC20_002677 [Loxospora ochrophaea]|nr:hypothetical protein [Loxospora ochrophaea]
MTRSFALSRPLLIPSFATVSWSWGGGQPSGEVAEKKTEGEVAIKSKRGNTIKKNADPENPAVHVTRSGQDVVKKSSELEVEEKADGADEKADGADAEEDGATDGDGAKAGEKRGREDEDEDEEAAPEAPKKQKGTRGRPKKVGGTTAPKKATEDAPKKPRGRPKKTDAPAPKKAAAADPPKPRGRPKAAKPAASNGTEPKGKKGPGRKAKK